ncbi:hypothetical protein [Actinomycetospora sp. NBRC 106378]|uniref:AAA family ATPase n=1 Tax=Actinomycetospora sp. NBRC 106378 TaxID=3032208 RepID=UPI0024A58F79|nr:hypothetical protein [Actinomycetospora sp. NBRC 106378]GLZ51494.1 hypothetical protein Acsp07_11110 [Actinomycetospora sp. NBRC 106378]
MRLLRIRLRDFRGVHDREVHLAESGVTVLEGENEVGKTSTVVALDLLIDFRDDSRAAPVRAAAPSGRDAGPEVEAEFVTGPYRVVYRKRWLRRRLTELTVTGPATEQLTGREAHDRLLAILDETMDRDLWLALRVEQHTPLGQADLGGHDALTRALDRAAGGGGAEAVGPAADAAAEGLVERALAEVRRYHGGHGRPVGPLREAAERERVARAEAEAAAAAVSEVERDVDLRADLDREAASLAEERRTQNARVHELEDRWSALQARQQEVATSAERAEAARERAARATERQDARTSLVAVTAAAEGAAEDAGRILAGLEAGDRARREDLAERRAEADRAQAASDAATAAARTAADALAAARDRTELADLRGRLRRAGTAEEARREAARAVAGPCADAAAVDRLETLDRAVVQAEAELAAGAATVEVTGLADHTPLTVDGADREIADGETTTLPVADAVTIDVPGAVRLTVRPGLDGEGARRRVADARAARDAACAALEVPDVAAARAALRTAGEAAARSRELAAVVERELAGRSFDDVRTAVTALAERMPAEAAPEPTTRRRGARRAVPDEPGLFEEAGLLDDPSADPEPEDLEPLRLEAVRSLDLADEAHRLARTAEDAWRRLDASVTTAGAEVVAARTAQAVARSEADRRVAELRAARAEHADEALTAAATEALARARRFEADHEQRAAALEADDPTTVEALYATAKRAVEALTRRTADVERRRAEVTGRLQVAGGEGRHDRLAAARTELAAAEREHASVSRRAAAAVRLHETLARRRDEVRRAYVAPFRREVERLARIVFGPSLALEVDPALRIVSRTLNGVTVPFDALSTGAKEQLGLCARLAVAALVDAEDGVPVLIDDALGHSDPGRLERLAAVFGAAAAGSSHQVVVLTCTPARYRGIGATRTVTLNPSYPPPQAVPDGNDDHADAENDDGPADTPSEEFRAG